MKKANSPKIKILIVEDEAIVAKDLQNMLVAMDYEVVAVVDSGKAAFEKARKLRPDLIIMDIVLKGSMDGIEAAKLIKNEFDTPFIYLTAYADEEKMKRSIASAPYAYLLKPFREKELYIAIKIALYKHQAELNEGTAGEVLKISEEKYRGLFNNMREGFAYCKMIYKGGKPWDFIYLAVNPSFERLTGLGDVVGKKVSEVIPGLRRAQPELFDIYGKVAKSGKPWKFETFNEAYKGWLSISVYSPEKGYFVAVFDNVTEHKKVEQKLDALYDRQKSILATVPDIIMEVDNRKTYTWANQAGYDFFGPDVIGKNADSFFVGRQKTYEAVKPIFSGRERTISLESWQRRKDGQVRLLAWTCRPLKDIHGRVTGALSSAHDITEREEAAELIQKQDELLNLTGAMAKIGGWEFDVKTLKGTWTDEVARIHDLDPTHETNVRLGLSFYKGEWRKKIKKAIRDAIKLGKPYDLELKMTSAKGVNKWVRTKGIPVKADGKVVKIHGIFHDITELVHAREALIRTNRALRVISECNEVLVRETEEQTLFKKICRLLVKDGNYKMAWVGFIEDDKRKSVRPAAFYGGDGSFLKDAHVSRKGTIVCRNLHGGHRCTHWRALAKKYGFATSAVFPLIVDGKMIGVLNIYSGNADAFNETEMKLLTELAGDLSYGIMAIRAREQLIQSRKEIEDLARFPDEDPNPIVRLRSDGEILYLNTPGKELLRQLGGSFCGALKSKICRVFRTGQILNTEIAIKDKFFLASVVPFRKSGYINLYARDVTGWKQAEHELKKFKLGIESSDQIVFMTDKAGHILYVNPTFEKTYGFKSEEVIGKTPRVLKSGVQLPDFYKRLWRDLLGKKTVNVDVINKTKDGRLIDVRETANPILDERGEVLGFLALQTDITEQNKIAIQLLKSRDELENRVRERTSDLAFKNALLSMELENSLDGILIIDTEGKIVTTNRRFAEMWKIPSAVMDTNEDDKLLDFVVDQLQNPDEFRRAVKYFYAKRNKKARTLIPFKDGRVFDRYTAPLVSADGQYYGRLWSFRDMSKEAEVNKAKNEFVALVSHQLRTPLTGTKWIIQAIMARGGLNEWQKEFLADALKSNDRMIALVNDLLNISRLDAGVIGFSPKKTEVISFINNIIEEISKDTRARHLKIIFKPSSSRMFVMLDPMLTRQVVANLLSNAVKYSPGGKTITLAVRRLKNDFEISIKDHGIGISKEDQLKLFDKFFRSSMAENIDTKGSGLGLYVIKKILDVCRGRITCQSEQGKGSTFTVSLPLHGPQKVRGQKEFIPGAQS